jgi:hypothetical protein
MKTINKIKNISLLLVLIIMAGCEDQLDLAPETSYSDEQVFSTEEGVESAINGMWATYVGYDYHGFKFHQILNPNSGRFNDKNGSATRDAASLNTVPTNTVLNALWKGMYRAINNANIIIYNLENTSIELTNLNTSLGQAYFIRAITYFELVQLFGAIPLRVEPTTNNTLHIARTPTNEVYAVIISDLNKASQLLPERGEYRHERPIKYAANAFLSKVYMRLAGEDGGDPSLWKNAYDEAIKVVGNYTLLSSYNTLFQIDPMTQNTEESILELQYGLIGASRSNDIARTFTPSNYYLYDRSIRTFGRVKPNKEIYDQHVNQYPGDPRIEATFIHDSYQDNRGKTKKVYPVQKKGTNGFTYVKKYLDPSYNGTTSERNMIKMRYAEILLMLAEIENELNGPGNAYQYVNQVLERARNTEGTTEPADWSGMTQDEFRLRIMKERQFELLAEGQDWFDTRRRGWDYFLNEIILVHNSTPNLDLPKDYIYSDDKRSMLLPIPSSEIAGNQKINESDQNPGY